MNLKIKICGLTRRNDVDCAVEYGADYVGFVLTPLSLRCVRLEHLADLTRDLPIPAVGVFVNADRDFILRACERGIDIVQLHGTESAEFARSIDFAPVWKAGLHPEIDYPAEMLLCDAKTGGSGTPGDWTYAAELARVRPIFLAGGLNPDNLGTACRTVQPYGVDVSGGVELSPGCKDPAKMKLLFERKNQI